jgi:hypothetical protein
VLLLGFRLDGLSQQKVGLGQLPLSWSIVALGAATSVNSNETVPFELIVGMATWLMAAS